jgi:hypothetical protein
MIVFTCSQCGRRHQRSESAAGTLLYCPCGQANRVPWESTVAEAEPPAAEQKPPQAKPVEDAPDVPARSGDRPLRRPPRRRTARRRTDPTVCLNHPNAPSQHPCADCGESFCALCLVTLQERHLCGPCKNFRLHVLQRPPDVSNLALASMLVALLCSPVVFCLTLLPASISDSQSTWPFIWCAVCVSIPLLALFLGWKALRRIESDSGPRLGGQALALTGMTTAVIGLLWCLVVAGVSALHSLGM